MQDYAKCMVYYVLLFADSNKKAPNKQKTKENNSKTTVNTKCASKLLQVRFAYVF